MERINRCKNCNGNIPKEAIGHTWFCSDYCEKIDACGGEAGIVKDW